MKVLIISRSFFPNISPRSFRATELAKELARRGNQVTVLTHKFPEVHIPFEHEYSLTIVDLGKSKLPVVNVVSKNKYLRLIKRVLSRILKLLFEYPDIVLMFLVNKRIKNWKDYDLLISIAVPYPIHWGVALAQKKDHRIAKVWIADCGDPYYFNFIDSIRKPFYFRYLEKWFSRRTDFITIPRIEMMTTFFEEFHSKIVAIPQGLNISDIRTTKNPIKNPCPTFAFAGQFIKGKRDPVDLLNYLSSIEKDFRFIIYTQTTELIDPYRSLLGNRMIVNNYINRTDLIYELSKMDFLINIGFDPVTQFPSKLIDYALSGRPIFSISNGVFDKQLFNDFLEGNYSGQFKFLNLEDYDIKNVADKFLMLSDR